MESDPVAIEMNVDAALALQALVGIDAYPLVLALVPTIADWDDLERVYRVAVEELIRAGIVFEGREVHPLVEHWLQCLDRPDVELAVRVVRPTPVAERFEVLRMSLVRKDETHVLAVRNDDRLVIQSVFCVPGQLDALSAAVLAGMGPCSAAPIQAWAVPQDQVGDLASADGDELRRIWRELGADAAGARILTASEVVQSAEVVAYEHHDGVLRKPEHWVRILDTTEGRVVVSPRRSAGGVMWINYGPGDKAVVNLAIRELIALLPTGSWFDVSRV